MDGRSMLRQMTLQQKASLLAGASHWNTRSIDQVGLENIALSDGPHGLRHQAGAADHLGINESQPATCFPSASALACSFDRDLVEAVGRALADEAIDQGVSVVLGPGVNMKRSPLCGRNFEYFSEDPLLSGELGASMVRGIQSRGVAACVKHFACNNQELARLVSDSVVDERSLREVYLQPFERVVKKARPWSIMTAYNKLNGVYCSQNAWLLQRVLRDEWGFDGAAISDWGAVSDVALSVAAGLDLCMPGPRPDYEHAIMSAVRRGMLDEDQVDRAARRVVDLVLRTRATREVSGGRPALDPDALYRENGSLAARAARESAVLLENNGILPLDPEKTVAVIGAFAREPRYQGAGSSKINPYELDCALDEFERSGIAFDFAPGYDAYSGDATDAQIAQAVECAASHDVAVVFAGLPDRFESEGFDRKLMVMPRGHRSLIERVCRENPNTVVVLQGGAPMEAPWRRLPAAIMAMYLSGCRGGAAVVDLLYGRANPCGRLAETWPERLGDTALGAGYPDFDREVLYREGIYVGYRYFDAAGAHPAWPFGHGLSYTRFSYGKPVVSLIDHAERAVPDRASAASVADDISPCYRLELDVENAGPRSGAEVVQLYIALPEGAVFHEKRRLAAFAKVRLDAGERRRVSLEFGEMELRYWDAATHAWRIDAGEYELLVGSSSRDIRQQCSLRLAAGEAPFAVYPAPVATPSPSVDPVPPLLEPYIHPGAAPFDEESFKALYARPLPPRTPIAPFTIDSSVSEMASTPFGRLMIRVVERVMDEPVKKMDEDTRHMMREIVSDLPLRQLISSGFSMRTVEGLVDMLNGRYIRGCARALGAYRRIKKALREHAPALARHFDRADGEE